MSPVGLGTTGWLLIAAAALLIGLVLLRYGIWPRRRGDTPHCRKCDYNVTGLDSGRCPECGTELTEAAVVYGERRRRPVLIVLGVVFFLVATGLVAQGGRQVNWYRWWPTASVLGDLQSARPTVAAKAWRELQRREIDERLSTSQLTQLIDICLADQASTKMLGLTRAEVDYLGSRYLSDKLTPAQAKTFVDHLAVLSLKARPKVVLGDPIPLRIDETGRCPSWTMKVELWGWGPVFIDGRPTESRFALGSIVAGLGSRGSTACWVPCDRLGRHTVTVSVPLKVYATRHAGKSVLLRLCHQADVSLSATFEVVPADGPSPVKLIKNPSLQTEMHDAIEFVSLRPHPDDPDQLIYEIAFKGLPVNVAFDMIARIDGEEHPLATLTMREGAGMRYQAEADVPPKDTFDLILRSNEQVARKTIDLFEIWDGELVYESVFVERPATQSGPVPKPL